jgi:hypothetical protein
MVTFIVSFFTKIKVIWCKKKDIFGTQKPCMATLFLEQS